MIHLSNAEFEVLTSDQSSRLKMIAHERYKQDPHGLLTREAVDTYIKTCEYTGDTQSVQFLKNLVTLANNGMMDRIRTGATTWEDHKIHVAVLRKRGAIKFNIGDHVLCNDTGSFATIVDYLPTTKEYMVVIDPFQLKQYAQKDLEKIAKSVT